MAVTYCRNVNGVELEFVEEGHLYFIDGVLVPSITQILKSRFGGRYKFVDRGLLNRRAAEGTAVHKAIEEYCNTGKETDIPELRGFQFLQKQYGFKAVQSEVPVVLWDGDPIAAGRLDLVLKIGETIGGADIKCVSSLDRQYVAYQLNLYRIAYAQCYGVKWDFLRAIQLKGDKRRFVNVPIDENAAWELVWNYLDEDKERSWNSE